MSVEKKKILIIAPYWNYKQHLGKVRTERFVKWLNQLGYELTIVISGSSEKIFTGKYGKVIKIKDPIGEFPEEIVLNETKTSTRKPNKLRSFLARLILIPDYGIAWGWRVYFDKDVRIAAQNSEFILSSSPPESLHMPAFRLAKKYNKKHIVDLRDGWIDDPLKEELKKTGIRKFREQRLEKKVLKNSFRILITSSIWQKYIIKRYNKLAKKVVVITNGYPLDYQTLKTQKDFQENRIVLLYLGKLSLSRDTQKIDYVLEPLFRYSQKKQQKYEIRFVGKFGKADYNGLKIMREKYPDSICEVKFKKEIPKAEIKKELDLADGLLLLCISKAAIPSKFYDYIPTSKPILAITPNGSAVWNIGINISQVQLIDTSYMEKTDEIVRNYFDNIQGLNHQYEIPREFSEEYLSDIFRKSVINND